MAIQARLVLLVPLATKDLVESPDNLENLVSLEAQDYLEIKEKEVIFLHF